MLDKFVYGDANRLSPEAPVPIVRLGQRRAMPGGAGNVARNIEGLGGAPILIGLAGADTDGDELERLLSTCARLVRSRERRTTVKMRVIASNQQIVRIDDEDIGAFSKAEQIALLNRFESALPKCSAAILSDYGKGVLTSQVCIDAIKLCNDRGVFCLVDPKGRDYSRYAGADVLTPNAQELAEATAMPTVTDEEVEVAARALLSSVKIGAVLVTRSEKGMMLVPREHPTHIVSAMAREVFDVSGAGDTVIGTLGLSIAGGASLIEAMRLANAAAGVVVGKLGTAVCTSDELIHALRDEEGGIGGVLSLESVTRLSNEWRANGLKVGFANGCFDILHAGHTLMLRDARRHCDKLIVALNTDSSVSRLKGPARPLNTLHDRAAVIGALSFVDAVTCFEDDTPLETILAVRPDLLFKGSDYSIENVVGAPEIESWGGRTILLNLLPGRSTTNLVERARSNGPRGALEGAAQ
jgi:D-beta-D-heptose 7-phosphate kinase/D-beta-D-heptose 1-phosphate adenosyltransferase